MSDDTSSVSHEIEWTPDGSNLPSGAAAQTVEPRDDLLEPEPIAWQSYQVLDEQTVELSLVIGPADYVGVSVEVSDEASRVMIGLNAGLLPGITHAPLMAVESRVVVTLRRPLAGRPVVDPHA